MRIDALPSMYTVPAAWASTPFIFAYCPSAKNTAMKPPRTLLLCDATVLCTSAIAHRADLLAWSLWRQITELYYESSGSREVLSLFSHVLCT